VGHAVSRTPDCQSGPSAPQGIPRVRRNRSAERTHLRV